MDQHIPFILQQAINEWMREAEWSWAACGRSERKNTVKCRKYFKGKYRYKTSVRGSEFVLSLKHSSASYRKSSCTFFTALKTISSLFLEVNARETAYPVTCPICQSTDDLCQSIIVSLVPYCIYIDFHSQHPCSFLSSL